MSPIPCRTLLRQNEQVNSFVPPKLKPMVKQITSKGLTKQQARVFFKKWASENSKYRSIAARSPAFKDAVFPILAVLVILARVVRQSTGVGVGVLAKQDTKQDRAAKEKETQKPDVVQKPEEDEVVIAIPEQRLDTKTPQQQLRIITNIIGGLAVAQAFRIRGKRVGIAQTRLRGGVAKARKFIFNKLRKKRRSFTPDIYSLIFGIRASKGMKIKLLRRGRVFTGLERRAIVR